MSQVLGRTDTEADFVRSARWLAAGVLGGFVTGALVGGMGGRIAMFVLRLTSSPSLHGLQTDDDFTIGIVSGATVFLLGLTAFVGMLGGLVYLGVRGWLPARWRPWVTGGVAGVVGGAIVIRPGGPDFTLLEPLPLAVVMFTVIPAAYGVVLSFVVERQLRDGSFVRRSWVWAVGILPLALVALTGPIGLAAIIVLVTIWLLHRAVPSLGPLWRSTPVRWLGRCLLAALVTVELAELAGDINEIL